MTPQKCYNTKISITYCTPSEGNGGQSSQKHIITKCDRLSIALYYRDRVVTFYILHQQNNIHTKAYFCLVPFLAEPNHKFMHSYVAPTSFDVYINLLMNHPIRRYLNSLSGQFPPIFVT